MKKYFKKFSIIFAMTFVIMLGTCISAFADDGVVGTSNLNNTVQNSAKVGDRLANPEKGWKRYDGINNKILYEGSGWADNVNSLYYGGSARGTRSKNGKIDFQFYGSDLRIIQDKSTDRDVNGNTITIDGYDYGTINTFGSPGTTRVFTFEKKGLSKDYHKVEISIVSTSTMPVISLDAIDIDENGYLVGADESIILDKSSVDLTVGGQEQLTATTTPAGLQVVWSSSDSSIATVDSNGKVTALKEGTCTITATTTNGLTAMCTVNVTKGDTPPTDEPTGDGALFIELVDGNIKSYDVSSAEINKFIKWYNDRDNDESQPGTYKFTKGTYTDYVVHDKIDWFEVR